MKTSMIALVAALTATPAFAAEDTDGNRSDTIVVIATRTPTKLSETAAPVSVVTADDIAMRQSQSAFDALRLVPGLNIGGGPRSQGEMPAIRGFDKRQIILTVDGARRNTTETLRSPLYIDPSFVSRVEVLKGASSTNYGADRPPPSGPCCLLVHNCLWHHG